MPVYRARQFYQLPGPTAQDEFGFIKAVGGLLRGIAVPVALADHR